MGAKAPASATPLTCDQSRSGAYRNAEPTGTKGLQDITTKKDD